MKSGWGTLAGAYAGAKIAGGLAKGTTKGLARMMGAGKDKDKENPNAAKLSTGKGISEKTNSEDGEGQSGLVAGSSLEQEMNADKKKNEQYGNQAPSPNEKNNNGQIKGVGSTTPPVNSSDSVDEVASTIEGNRNISPVDQQGNLQSTPSNANRNVSRLSNPNTETAPSPNLTSTVSPSDTAQSPSNSSNRNPSSTSVNQMQHVPESFVESDSSATQSTKNHSQQMQESSQVAVRQRGENEQSETQKLPKTYSTQTLSSQERASRIRNASKR